MKKTMNYLQFIKSKLIYFLFIIFIHLLLALFFITTYTNQRFIVVSFYSSSLTLLIYLTITYLILNKNYFNWFLTLSQLEDKYLITTVKKPSNNYESQMIYYTTQMIGKQLQLKVYDNEVKSKLYHDYLDLWIHEIKIPLQNISLLSADFKVKAQINKLDNILANLIFLSKNQYVNTDFHITSINLKQFINLIIKQNKNLLIESNIKITNLFTDQTINSDPYWLGYIITQLIDNSIKYKATTIELGYNNGLYLLDNGMGIKEEQINFIFDKSFVGSNARKFINATGMGLYIVDQICQKLNLVISCESSENIYTKMTIRNTYIISNNP